MEIGDLQIRLKLPDQWQRQAVRALLEQRDVVVHAPTGSGKTYIAELLPGQGWRGSMVFSVPTRALANDKYLEWQQLGWNVGLVTGDRVVNPRAPVVVATLETQLGRLRAGEGPDLLVVDEYQMVCDHARGHHYETALAMAPEQTRLLLLSGSVSNPEEVVAWLRRLGREVELVFHDERAVPLEEVFLESLPKDIPHRITGFWPKLVARALYADCAPLLIFTPRRRESEHLARQLAQALPSANPLVLTDEQRHLSGKRLAALLEQRIAYHHSGLTYDQRAGLIEPLAKQGQLKVVVATTGLAAGVNFSTRSVLVLDNRYQVGRYWQNLRADELLQMFGRAGRRGRDDTGFALVAPDRPRLLDAAPIRLRRSPGMDWPGYLGVMAAAAAGGHDPVEGAMRLHARMFTTDMPELGFSWSQSTPDAPCGFRIDSVRHRFSTQQETELLDSRRKWVPRPEISLWPLSKVRVFEKGRYRQVLKTARCLQDTGPGSLCRLPGENGWVYARRWPVARLGNGKEESVLWVALPNLRKQWRAHGLLRPGQNNGQSPNEFAGLLTTFLRTRWPELVLISLKEENETVEALLSLEQVSQNVPVDEYGVGLLDAPTRSVSPKICQTCPYASDCRPSPGTARGIAWTWYRLGLLDQMGRPTMRGKLMSFYLRAEGIAVAAALEEVDYPINDLLWHLANLRAGHRFEPFSAHSSRLGSVCRALTGGLTAAGYLEGGVPLGYGDGAAEILQQGWTPVKGGIPFPGLTDLRSGDVERMRQEWTSLLRMTAAAPPLPWDRWNELRSAAADFLKQRSFN